MKISSFFYFPDQPSTQHHPDWIAVQEILIEHQIFIIGAIESLNLSQEEKEELTTDFFLKVLYNIEKVISARKPVAYLRGIVNNLHIDLYRKRTRKNRLVEQYIDTIRRQGNSFLEEQDEAILREQSYLKLNSAISKLPNCQREVIYLRYWEGLSYKQIQACLGLEYHQVNNAISRAKKNLQNLLGKK